MADKAPSMTGKTVVITGGTGGIGRATAIGLATLGAQVAITGRHRERAEATAAEIREATGNPQASTSTLARGPTISRSWPM